MKFLKSVFKRPHRISGKKIAVTTAAFLAIVTAGFVGISGYSNNQVAAGDCSGNSIIKCGAGSRAAFINDVKKSSELQKIYAHFGLTSADYTRFINDAVPGVAYRSDNTIKVGGRTVATNVWSIGRWASYQGSGYKTVVIKGAGTYYGNYNNKAFAPSASTIPVDVLFNSKGQMQFAVMTGSCGNPAIGTPTTPSYACKSLNATSLGNNKWNFTTSASAGNGAKITKLVYDFGDGSKTVTTTNPATAVSHTFTKTSNVTVSVYVSLPGGGTAILKNCTHKITFTPPPASYACTNLTLNPGKPDSAGNTPYTLAATASVKNATIKNYVFTFGDGKSSTITTSSTSAKTSHTYAPGNYTAKVAVTVVTDAGKTVSVTSPYNCEKPVNVKTPECKPGVPVGSPECKPSTLACVSLSLVPGKVDSATGATSYTLKAAATADNATITSYVFDFGDSAANTTVTTGSTTASTTHTYQPGDWTASVTVNGKDASGKPITGTASANCQQKITVKTPECKPGVPKGSPECSTLTCSTLSLVPGDVDASGNQSYTLNAAATADNATITSYDFSFGDNTKDTTVTTGATTASTTHTYAPGNWTATVTVNGKDASGADIQATSASCSQPVTVGQPKSPAISITKTVDSVKQEQVAVGQHFIYQLIITNTGTQDLTNAVVTDTPPTGVTLLSADLGTISGNGWTYTIPSLAVGDSVTVNVTAVVNAYVPGNLVNTACVNAPEVNPNQPTQPDSCDTATVTVTPPAPVLVNTGAGSVVGVFGIAAGIGTLGYRFFLGRRLNREA